MAQSITLTSGSVLNGNPITIAIKPNQLVGGTPSFHRVMLDIECGIGDDLEVIKMSTPVFAETGEPITIDISSALRTFRDTCEYTPQPTLYPIVRFNVRAYDEYMLNGTVRTNVDSVWFPANPDTLPDERREEAYLRTLFGSFTDIERITSGTSASLTALTRKPTTLPQLVKVGEPFAYTPPYTTPQTLAQSSALTPPQSKVAIVPKEGLQTLGYQSIYALPANAPARSVFRFINGFGVMESVSLLRQFNETASHTNEQHVVSRQETFNQFSRAIVRKTDGPETWRFQTDPLDQAWLRWYIHEFQIAEHIWLYLPSHSGEEQWLRVHLIPEDTTTIVDRTKSDHLALQFTVRFDINGSPI